MSTGALCSGFVVTCGGRYKLKFISVPVTFDWWASFNSLPPKEAILAFVVTDMVDNCCCANYSCNDKNLNRALNAVVSEQVRIEV